MAKRESRRSEQLRDAIEERIASAAYAPGARLDEEKLAGEFGVSRTPVREALLQLASSGLIDLRPRRGAIVAELSAFRLLEMFEVMAELEAMCARLAARRITVEEERLLRQCHASCREARDRNDPDEYYRRNHRFHRLIYAASHNAFLIEQASQLQRRLHPYRRLQLRVRDRLQSSFAEHDGVVEAILAHDPQRAADALRNHVVVQGERFTDLVSMLASLRRADERTDDAATDAGVTTTLAD